MPALFHRIKGSIAFLTTHPAYASHPLQAWLSVFRWYGLVLFKRQPKKSVPDWDMVVQLPSLFKTPAKVFYVFGKEYDETLSFLDRHLPLNGAFLDVGANFGIYSLLAAKQMPEQEVLFFDPIPQMCELAEENARTLQLSNLTIHQVGLGQEPGTSTLHLHRDNGRSSFRKFSDEEVGSLSVTIETLDRIVPETLSVAAMKLDVEGYECKALAGAAKLLARWKPLILFENNPTALAESGDSQERLYQMLIDAGYAIYEEQNPGTLVKTKPEAFGNFIAIHPEGACSELGTE